MSDSPPSHNPADLDRRSCLALLAAMGAASVAAGGDGRGGSSGASSSPGSSSSSSSASSSSSSSSSSSASAASPGSAFVAVPANAAFVFGADVSNTSGAGEAAPITDAYWMGATLVTNAQYKLFTDTTARATPRHWSSGTYPTGKADHPVLWVSLTDATAYAAWLTTQLGGWTVRLPTEAEWENAARGPSGYVYPWGNSQGSSYSGGTLTSLYNYNAVCSAYYLANDAATLATYNNSNSPSYGVTIAIGALLSISSSGGVSGWIDHDTYTGFVYTDVYDALIAEGGFTTAVGAYEAGKSAYGCYDMAGNAFEWTTSLITATNGAEAGVTAYAVRGGSWYSTGASGKSTYRGEGRAGTGAYHSVGFRVAAVKA